jgi:hypothetical protein
MLYKTLLLPGCVFIVAHGQVCLAQTANRTCQCNVAGREKLEQRHGQFAEARDWSHLQPITLSSFLRLSSSLMFHYQYDEHHPSGRLSLMLTLGTQFRSYALFPINMRLKKPISSMISHPSTVLTWYQSQLVRPDLQQNSFRRSASNSLHTHCQALPSHLPEPLSIDFLPDCTLSPGVTPTWTPHISVARAGETPGQDFLALAPWVAEAVRGKRNVSYQSAHHFYWVSCTTRLLVCFYQDFQDSSAHLLTSATLTAMLSSVHSCASQALLGFLSNGGFGMPSRFHQTAV